MRPEAGTEAGAASAAASRPWRRGVVWLLFLGPFFFLSYGLANAWAARQLTVPSIVFPWEAHIPFIPWSIVPYWSIDLLYGLSFLTLRSDRAVDRHALRLLTAQLVAVACFMLWPLRFSFAQPAVDGWAAVWFEALRRFDQPFNQAPSLHVALAVVLWDAFRHAVRRPWLRGLLHGWMLLIGVSVLTTWQHHFIDVPTGALLGLFCLWLWPARGVSPWSAWRPAASSGRRRIAAYYAAGAAFLMLLALRGGVWLWLFWPALSLSLVALIYLGIGAAGWQKHCGRLSVAALGLFAPYWAGAWINSRLWTFRHPQADEIADGVWLGRAPSRRAPGAGGFAALLDLCPELPVPNGPWRVCSLPWLDLVPPDVAQLRQAARLIEARREKRGEKRGEKGKLLVCCALGYSRSASAVAAWLLTSGRARSVDQAVAMIAARRPRLALGRAHRAALAQCLDGQ